MNTENKIFTIKTHVKTSNKKNKSPNHHSTKYHSLGKIQCTKLVDCKVLFIFNVSPVCIILYNEVLFLLSKDVCISSVPRLVTVDRPVRTDRIFRTTVAAFTAAKALCIC